MGQNLAWLTWVEVASLPDGRDGKEKWTDDPYRSSIFVLLHAAGVALLVVSNHPICPSSTIRPCIVSILASKSDTPSFTLATEMSRVEQKLLYFSEGPDDR
jgi:hypothetical protein